ncbi:DUF6201 family protein [Proteus vulgaris]|uniref:DUF6201 family protein n=1 Tax=Proteus vulgaris TaxID=585 RepID=UPI002876298A|nr:DUF6201 family protein [Proteus vulgaris]MDS0787439.1 DUF6201 family protein [Proteus vulgaris]
MKIIKYTLLTLFLLWWFFLSHVTFTTSWLYSASFKNEHYQAAYYHPAPINFFGIYFWLVNEQPVFVVLYDKEGKYIGQSSPFVIASNIHLLGGENVLPKTYEYDKKYGGYDNFYLNGGSFTDDYLISTKHKKWWSYILQYFH